jgi:outer membrane protein TolC
MKYYQILLAVLSVASIGASAEPLNLDKYLEQVKSQSADGRAAVAALAAAEQSLNQAELPYAPEFFAEYAWTDDRKETMAPAFMGDRTISKDWKLGLRKQTTFGLSGDLYYENGRSELNGVSPQLLPNPGFTDVKGAADVKFSLWRNGFGEQSRAELRAGRAKLRIAWLKAKMELKDLLLKAQNTYWTVVSYNQVIKLQQENVERAKRLRDRYVKKANLKLFDDIEAVKAEAALAARDLELEQSINDRAQAVREFNRLRGVASDRAEDLAALPEKELLMRHAKSSRHMSREDLQIAFETAKLTEAQSTAERSKIRPQLDLIGYAATNGHDALQDPAYRETEHFNNPTYRVGVQFSMPLDFSLLAKLRESHRASLRAAADQTQAAAFDEERVWNDLLERKKDAQSRFEKALNVERLNTTVVKRERQRLSNGRTTTFELLNYEQALAESQVHRVQAQLALLQIHNMIQTFDSAEVQK